MLPTCAFFCQFSWSLCFVPNFWILSRVVQLKRCPSFSLLSSFSSPLSRSHRVLLPLFRGFSPVYITEYIQKYCSIENFIKLHFQRVLIHLNRSPSEGAMAVLFPPLHAVQKISGRATFGNSAIPACRNLRLTWFLIRWKRNFMGLLNIQRYLVFLPWGCAEIYGNINFFWFDPNMLTTLILWSSGRYIASPSALSPHHCWTSE
jgi:hypothetical protein